MTLVVRVRGTGESLGRNMLSAVPGEELVYPAEIRPIGLRSYQESVSAAVSALREVDARGEPWVGVGYSLGAAALGDAAALGFKHCRGVVLVADPWRPRGKCAHRGVSATRYGCAGERDIRSVPAAWLAIPDDPITSCDAGDGFRLLANVVTVRQQRLLPSMYWDVPALVSSVARYLGTRHTAYGYERVRDDSRTYVQLAADLVERMS